METFQETLRAATFRRHVCPFTTATSQPEPWRLSSGRLHEPRGGRGWSPRGSPSPSARSGPARVRWRSLRPAGVETHCARPSHLGFTSHGSPRLCPSGRASGHDRVCPEDDRGVRRETWPTRGEGADGAGRAPRVDWAHDSVCVVGHVQSVTGIFFFS